MAVTDLSSWEQIATVCPESRNNLAWAPRPDKHVDIWGPEIRSPIPVTGAGTWDRRMWEMDGGGTFTAHVPNPVWSYSDAAFFHSMAWDGEKTIVHGGRDSGERGSLLTSTNGSDWDRKEFPIVPLGSSNSVCWSQAKGKFFAVKFGSNEVMASADGTHWSVSGTLPMPDPSGPYATSVNPLSIVWVADLGLFLIGSEGYGAGNIFTSPDGIIWTARSNPGMGDFAWVTDFAWSPSLGRLVAVGGYPGNADQVATSPDGITWTGRGMILGTNQRFEGVCWSPARGIYAAVGQNGGSCFTSPDGITWTFRQQPMTVTFSSGASYCWDIDWSPTLGLFCAVGYDTNTGARTTTVSTSPDAITWTKRGNPFTSPFPGDASGSSVSWVPFLSRFVASSFGSGGETIVTSGDGVNWSSSADWQITGLYNGKDIASNSTTVVLVGYGQSIDLASTWAWDPVAPRFNKLHPATEGPKTSRGRMVGIGDDGAILIYPDLPPNYLFGSTPGTLKVWLWDGTTWHDLAPPGPAPAVIFYFTIAFDGTDILVYISPRYNYSTHVLVPGETWKYSISENIWSQFDLEADDLDTAIALPGAAEVSMVWAGDRAIMPISTDPILWESDGAVEDAYTVQTWKFNPGTWSPASSSSDATAWAQLFPSSSPTGFDPGFWETLQEFLLTYDGKRVLAYDPERGRLWSYGEVKTHLVTVTHRNS